MFLLARQIVSQCPSTLAARSSGSVPGALAGLRLRRQRPAGERPRPDSRGGRRLHRLRGSTVPVRYDGGGRRAGRRSPPVRHVECGRGCRRVPDKADRARCGERSENVPPRDRLRRGDGHPLRASDGCVLPAGRPSTSPDATGATRMSSSARRCATPRWRVPSARPRRRSRCSKPPWRSKIDRTA